MSVQLIMHNVSGQGNHCFYRAMYQALLRSNLLADIGCQDATGPEVVKCLRAHIAALVKTSIKAREVVTNVMDLAHVGIIEEDTIMAEYAKMYPDEYLTDRLEVTLAKFAHIIETRPVMADSLDFELMDTWLSKFNINLFNVTSNNAASSESLLKLITGNYKTLQDNVIFINTNNTHYNWVSIKYRLSPSTGTETDVMMNRELLVMLLQGGDPQVSHQSNFNSHVNSTYSTSSQRAGRNQMAGRSQRGGLNVRAKSRVQSKRI